jgi:GT2 family glycosyltransferase
MADAARIGCPCPAQGVSDDIVFWIEPVRKTAVCPRLAPGRERGWEVQCLQSMSTVRSGRVAQCRIGGACLRESTLCLISPRGTGSGAALQLISRDKVRNTSSVVDPVDYGTGRTVGSSIPPGIRLGARPTICVVVPVHNGGAKFRQCLSALSELDPPPDDIIVVADADTDGSADLAESFRARVIRLGTQSGPARARNIGASAVEGDIVLFIDADVVISPDAIAQVGAIFAQRPDMAAVFGSYDDRPGESNFLSQYKNLLHHYVHQTGAEDASTFWAGCGAIRREVFLSLGGFDESYGRPCIEDIELGYRLKRAGHTIRLCKTLQGKHLKRWDAISLLKTDFFQRALPWTDLIFQDRSMVNDLNLNHASRVSVVFVYALLASLLGAAWRPEVLGLSAVLAVSLLALNAALYRFFWSKRGLLFALRAIPWHWLYYVCSGAAFGLGLVRHLPGRPRIPQDVN